MQKITSNLLAGQTAIYIGVGAFRQLRSLYDFGEYSKAFIVTDQTVAPLLLEQAESLLPLETALIVMPPGEDHKSIASIQKIWTAMHDAGCDRKSLVINLGGGVITDM